MKLIAWNSQGQKWDAFWKHYILPAYNADSEGVIALLVESGWAPWVTPGNVVYNGEYWHDSGQTWFNENEAIKSSFCMGVAVDRRHKALWVPWMNNPIEAKATNTRCSMGGAMLPETFALGTTDRIEVAGFKRPVIRVTLGKTAAGGGITPKLTILLVHMVSGYPGRAQAQLSDLISAMSRLIPQGTSGIIVGDMNVDLQTREDRFELPDRWRFLRTGQDTQQSGSELDYGILYDPTRKLPDATAKVRERYHDKNNKSDHSVIEYHIPFSSLG